jgi:hypothetical protein
MIAIKQYIYKRQTLSNNIIYTLYLLVEKTVC